MYSPLAIKLPLQHLSSLAECHSLHHDSSATRGSSEGKSENGTVGTYGTESHGPSPEQDCIRTASSPDRQELSCVKTKSVYMAEEAFEMTYDLTLTWLGAR